MCGVCGVCGVVCVTEEGLDDGSIALLLLA